MRCKDCNKPNFNILKGLYQKFYYVNACNTPSFYYTDIPCCMKYICLHTCKFKIKCKVCNEIIVYRPINQATDLGWNHIEGKKEIEIMCDNCDFKNIKKMVFIDEVHNYLSIGNLV